VFPETWKHKKTQETWELKCKFADAVTWLLKPSLDLGAHQAPIASQTLGLTKLLPP